MSGVTREQVAAQAAARRVWWMGAAPAVGVVTGRGDTRCLDHAPETAGNSPIWADHALGDSADLTTCGVCGRDITQATITALRAGTEVPVDGIVRRVGG